MKTEKQQIEEIVNHLRSVIDSRADWERLKREQYDLIKQYADDLAIDFVHHRQVGSMPKWAIRNELQMFKESRR